MESQTTSSIASAAADAAPAATLIVADAETDADVAPDDSGFTEPGYEIWRVTSRTPNASARAKLTLEAHQDMECFAVMMAGGGGNKADFVNEQLFLRQGRYTLTVVCGGGAGRSAPGAVGGGSTTLRIVSATAATTKLVARGGGGERNRQGAPTARRGENGFLLLGFRSKALAVPPNPTPPQDSSLLVHLKFLVALRAQEDAEGPAATREVKNHGTLGACFLSVAADAQVVQLPQWTAFRGNAYTFCAWLKPKDDVAGADANAALRVLTSTYPNVFAAAPAAAAAAAAGTSSSWIHLAVVLDFCARAPTTKVYVNGEPQGRLREQGEEEDDDDDDDDDDAAVAAPQKGVLHKNYVSALRNFRMYDRELMPWEIEACFEHD